MIQKKRIFCVAAALIFLLAAGCGPGDNTPSPSEQDASEAENSGTEIPAENDERVYSIPLGDAWLSYESWIVDKDGNEIMPKEEDTPDYIEIDLLDLATGEIRYRYRQREEIVRDEQGYPRTHRMRSLYDLNGNQLLDWEDKTYGDAFGEYIIRQDSRDGIVSADEIPADYHTALYHVPTGEESYEGAFSAAKLDSDVFLLCANWSTPLGTVNVAGEIVSGFPMPKPYFNAYIWNGYFVASSVHPYERREDNMGMEYLLDSDFRELYAFDSVNGMFEGLRGDYLMYQNGDERGIFRPDDGILFSVDGASIEYYDGDLTIVQTGSYYRPEEEGPINAALVTTDHREIAGGFSWLTTAQTYADKEPAEKFLGLSGGKAVLLDRDGKVLASSVELPGACSISMLCDGLYIYVVETDELRGTGLLGPELEVLVPAGRYTWISLAPGIYHGNVELDGKAETTLLQAYKDIWTQSRWTVSRTDILDHTGKMIVDNVTEIYDVGPDRIALRRGFDIGLMDWDGNWIAKRSIFSNMGDD